MKIRDANEIQKAHDILLPLLAPNTGLPQDAIAQVIGNDADRMMIHAMLDTLCWVLEHDHNTAFATNLERIKSKLEELGFYIGDSAN